MSSALRRGTHKAGLGLGILAAGGALGALGGQLFEADSEPADAAVEATSLGGQVGSGETLACSIYDAPSLEYPAFPRSSLSDGGVYVMLCEDSSGNEVVNELFIHRMADRTNGS